MQMDITSANERIIKT